MTTATIIQSGTLEVSPFTPYSQWLLEQLPEGVAVTDTSGQLTYVNQAFASSIERSPESLLGQPLEAFTLEEDMLRLVGFDLTFGRGPVRDLQILFTTGTGQMRALLITSKPWCHAGREQIILCTRESGSMQEVLADASRMAASEQQRSDELARARDALMTKNEQLQQAQEGLRAAFSRMTEHIETQEKLEAELRLAQKLEAIGQLAAGVAHEINSPMQYIGDNVAFLKTGFEQILQLGQVVRAMCSEVPELATRLQQAEEQAQVDFLIEQIPEAIDQTADGVARVSQIVQAMKAFSHQDQDDMTPEDINTLIKDTLVVARSEYKHVARVETDYGELPFVCCFGGQLRQVVLNLIVNAAHALAGLKEREPVIRVTTAVEADLLLISIADNGTGIPSHIQGRVFDPFFTTKPVGKGTGQGLSLARRIVVEGHHGSLSFESEAGVGTTFYIRIPVAGTADASKRSTAL